MSNVEIKSAIDKAKEIGNQSAIDGLPRVPHHNSLIIDFVKSLNISEMTVPNMKIQTKIYKEFSSAFTKVVLREAIKSI